MELIALTGGARSANALESQAISFEQHERDDDRQPRVPDQ
jgi:hypothetical protein